MTLSGTIDFWSDGVFCFCHEALGRALHNAFPDISISKVDIAHQKYLGAASYPDLERSAWYEFLRNGPSHTFTLPFGIDGRFSRYRIEFNLPDNIDESVKSNIQRFLEGLKSRSVKVDHSA